MGITPLYSAIMRKTLSFIMALGCALSGAVGANVFKEAQTAIKNGNGLENAEKKLLEKAVQAQTSHKDRARCYYMAGLVNRKINDIENEKVYLKQSYDTARFFSSIYNLFTRMSQCDSVESCPDEKGRVTFRYRKKARALLLPYRSNLLNGGKFYLRKQAHAQAYAYFDQYIGCASLPLFGQDFFLQSDTSITQAAYWATLSAYNVKDAARTLKHVDLALQRDAFRPYLQEYKAKSHLMLRDSAAWLADLKEGLLNYPEHTYFFASLMDYFNEVGRYEEGLLFADTMIHYNPKSPLLWYAKSAVLLNMRRYEECIAVCDSVLALDSTYVDAYYNKGISYCNMAVLRTEALNPKMNKTLYAREREAVVEFYRQALEPMNRVRALTPDDKARWANPLYRIYLNLNMGKEFDEIDALLKASK